MHLPCGSWMQRLCWKIHPAAAENPWSHWVHAKEGTLGTGQGGRDRELLAVSQKRPKVGETRILGPATGSGREMSLPLPHHLEMFWDLRGETEMPRR